MIPDISKRKPLTILAFDPGKLTGVSYFRKGEYIGSIAYRHEDLIELVDAEWTEDKETYVIIESFRLYAHKLESQTNDDLLTPQIIGKLKEWYKEFQIVMQQASTVKGFFTNQRLKEMDLYVSNRHCRDAVRHALYALYFNKEVK